MDRGKEEGFSHEKAQRAQNLLVGPASFPHPLSWRAARRISKFKRSAVISLTPRFSEVFNELARLTALAVYRQDKTAKAVPKAVDCLTPR
jgi:hypothetical protein